jgi:pyridoxal phosphate-dependent aminotransferase EpsN
MSPALLSRALDDYRRMDKLPKAVIVVDIYGLPACYDRILEICSQFGVPVVEDAAEALGSSYRGHMCGSFGDIGVLSFNANKIITTSGGGMVLAKEEKAVDKMKYWATQAKENTRHYEHKEIGYNYRLSNICAGIGRGQMETIDSYVEARRRIYNKYVRELDDLPVSFYPIIDGAIPNCWLTVMMLGEDCGVAVNDIMVALEKENIESRPFWKPMHMQPIYTDCIFNYHDGTIPVGKRLFETSLCLPSGSAMREDVLSEIIEIIRGCF